MRKRWVSILAAIAFAASAFVIPEGVSAQGNPGWGPPPAQGRMAKIPPKRSHKRYHPPRKKRHHPKKYHRKHHPKRPPAAYVVY